MKAKYADEFENWMSDDHTFCLNECSCFQCWRHRLQIQDHSIPHSFAYMKGTPDCEIEIVKKRQQKADDGGK